MCGIAGLIGRLDDRHLSALRRMNDALTHRGPDGCGFWKAPVDDLGWTVMLAHRRLSILDLSDAAAQPMCDSTTGDALVLNGEIYNYVELRRAITANRDAFRSTGDTEVLLRLLIQRGAEAVQDLRGMFAIGYFDAGERTLLLARDPLGIKPLYVARNPDPEGEWSILFASELRAILASGLWHSRKLNPRAPAMLLWNGFMIAPETAIDGIHSLLPGESLLFDGKGCELSRSRYWRARQPIAPKSSMDDLSAALQESVRLHLASDVPLGVFLSGGIDSSAVANLAQRTSTHRVVTFTLAFEERDYNEGGIARKVAEAIGTDHRELTLTEDQFMDDLERALDSLDQPTFDGLNSYFMSHAVRRAGIKVALVGSGGDELFGGYASFRDLPRLLEFARAISWMPKRTRSALGAIIAGLKQRSHGQFAPQTRWAKLPEMFGREADLVSFYQLAYALFLPGTQRTLLGRAYDGLIDGLPATTWAMLREDAEGQNSLEGISTCERALFLGERLLRDTDAASMSASIEVRLPLVDSTFVRLVEGLSREERFEPIGRKSALRKAGLSGLDPELFERPKAGFVMPYDRWLRNRLGTEISDTLRDSALVAAAGLDSSAVERLWQAFRDGAPGLYWSRIWAIYVFVQWCARHRVTL